MHVKTLRAAARDGRLPVTYDTRTTFRQLRARATPADATAFRRSYYGRTVRPADRREPLTWTNVPDDYDLQIRALRRARGLSQAQLATLVGAAHKAVVYQWEARKRHAVARVLATNRRAPRARRQSLGAPFARPNGAGTPSTMRTVSRLTWTIRRIAASRARGWSNHQ